MAMNGNFSAACFLSKQKEILGFTDSHMVQVDQNTLPDMSGVLFTAGHETPEHGVFLVEWPRKW
jgi:hypothetical protein